MPTGGIHATPGRAAGRPALGVNPSPTAGSDPATGAAGGLGKNAKSADISQSKKIAKEPAFKDYAAERSHRFKLQNHISKLMMANATAKGKSALGCRIAIGRYAVAAKVFRSSSGHGL